MADLTPELAADRAAAAISLDLLRKIEANLPGALADTDPECLHDVRVAVRRTRSLLRELRPVFPPRSHKHFRTEFRWVQQVTGPTRDLDVYLGEFGEFAALVEARQRPGLDVFRSILAERRAAERALMEAALRSGRMNELLRDWTDFLDALPTLPVGDRPPAAWPIGELAARRILRVYRQMVKMGGAIGPDSPHEALHDLRKKGKELRYLLEFFADLFPREVIKPMVKTLKSLQDALGRFQDREVQAQMIRELAEQTAAETDAAEALVQALERQQDEARADFDERFEAFASDVQRALVARTFA